MPWRCFLRAVMLSNRGEYSVAGQVEVVAMAIVDKVKDSSILGTLRGDIDMTACRKRRCSDPKAVLFCDPGDDLLWYFFIEFAHPGASSGEEMEAVGWELLILYRHELFIDSN